MFPHSYRRNKPAFQWRVTGNALQGGWNEMKKGKTLLALVMTLAMCLSLANVAAAEESKEIIFWNFFTGPDGQTMTELVNGYNATNPEYIIKSVTMNSSDLYTKIPTVVASGEGIPDLCIIDVARVASFYSQGVLEDMSTIMAAQTDICQDNYNALVWQSGTFDGTQYSIPLDIGAMGVHYNKDLVDKYCPHILDDGVITINELKEIIPAASADGIVTLGNYFFYETVLALAEDEGNVLFNEDGSPNANSEQIKHAISTLKEIVDMGGCTDEGDEVFQMFVSGEVIFMTTGVWDANSFNSFPELNWGVAGALAYEPTHRFTYCNSNQFALLKNEARSDSKESGIADFINYVRKNALIWAGSGMVPASSAANDDPVYQAMKQYAFVATEEARQSLCFRTNVYCGYFDDAVNPNVGEIVYGHKDLDETLDQVQKQIEENIAQSK